MVPGTFLSPYAGDENVPGTFSTAGSPTVLSTRFPTHPEPIADTIVTERPSPRHRDTDTAAPRRFAPGSPLYVER